MTERGSGRVRVWMCACTHVLAACVRVCMCTRGQSSHCPVVLLPISLLFFFFSSWNIKLLETIVSTCIEIPGCAAKVCYSLILGMLWDCTVAFFFFLNTFFSFPFVFFQPSCFWVIEGSRIRSDQVQRKEPHTVSCSIHSLSGHTRQTTE